MDVEKSKDERWTTVLETIELIKEDHPEEQTSMRGAGMIHGNGTSCIYKATRGDGTDSVYFITVTDWNGHRTVTVDRFVDSHERYWEEQISDRSNAVVIDGTHYRVGTSSGGPHAGYGGRLFKLRNLSTGEETETHDFWYQGKIPPMFRDLLPDTHEFVTPTLKGEL